MSTRYACVGMSPTSVATYRNHLVTALTMQELKLALGLVVFLATVGTAVFVGITYGLFLWQTGGVDEESQTRFGWKFLLAMHRELAFTLLNSFLYPFGLLSTLRMVGKKGPPIVLVPGYAMNRACLFILRWRLVNAGLGRVYIVNLPGYGGEIHGIADRLAARLSEISKRHDEELYVIAHSLGGLIMRSAHKQHPELPIRYLLTVGTPHRGTWIAHLSGTRNGRQMTPGSKYLRDLDHELSDESGNEFKHRMGYIMTPYDNIVFPVDTARVGHNHGTYTGGGHIALLYDRSAFRLIQNALKSGIVDS